MLDSIAYLNGEWMPLREARIPVLDRGFLFGDGIYDALVAYNRIPFYDSAHMTRLGESLRKINMLNPFTVSEWKMLIRELIKKNGNRLDHSIFIEVTRGIWDGSFLLAEDAQPTILMLSLPYTPPDDKLRQQGISAITAEDMRSGQRNIKSTARLGNLLARHLAAVSNASEAIFFGDDRLIEGTSSNILAVINGILCVPPKSDLILAGVTCSIVLDLAARHGVPVETRHIMKSELQRADEIWLTSTLKQVLAVTTLDGQPVGNAAWLGRPGPLYKKMAAWFEEEKARVMQRG